jgi:hypothetical protein
VVAPTNPVPVPTAPTTAPATPTAAITLDDVQVSTSGSVVVTLKMSNANVRPLPSLLEGASATYPMQYVVDFKGGASRVASNKIPVGAGGIDSVVISEKSGKLRVTVNATESAEFKFTGSGPTYTITASKK